MFDGGKETTVKARGKTWTFGRVELSLVEEFRDWIARQYDPSGDIFADCERWLGKAPEADWRELFAEAKALKKQLAEFSIAGPLAQQWMRNERGAAQLAYLMLLPKHPEMTPALAFEIVQEAGAAELARAVQAGAGRPPKNAPAPAAG